LRGTPILKLSSASQSSGSNGEPAKNGAMIPIDAVVCTICRYVKLQTPVDGELDIHWPSE
jgi:hypothetical protein